MSETKYQAVREQVEELLYHEADLIDTGRLDDWLALFTDDAHYWIPCTPGGGDPSRNVSVVYDDRSRLRERVWRITSGLAYAQNPPSRTLHLIGNVRIEASNEASNEAFDEAFDEAAELTVKSSLMLVELRRGVQTVYAGHCLHKLTGGTDGWRIKLKQINLLNSDQPLDSLAFIL